MNFLEKMKNVLTGSIPIRHPPESTTERQELTHDLDGNPIYSDDFVAFIKSELDKRKRDRLVFEEQWKMNTNFLNDHQYCDINPASKMCEDYPAFDDYSERGVYNRIAPIMATRQASLNTLKYNMTVRPRTQDLDDIDKAAVSTKLLRHAADVVDFGRIMHDAVNWAEHLGTAYIYSYWDTNAGRVLEDISTIEISSDGEESQSHRIIREGDLGCGILSPYEVFPEDLYKQEVSDQHSVIIEQIMTRDEIYDVYGIVVDGSEKPVQTISGAEVNSYYGIPSTVMSLTQSTKSDAESVITYFEKRSRQYECGRMAIIIGDELIWYSSLPYSSIPLVAIKSEVVPGQFFGRSVIRRLIPYQRAYNGTKNKIHDYLKAITTGKDYVAEGSVDIDDYIEHAHDPGYPIVYKPGYDRPVPRQNEALPSDLYRESQELERAMEYAAGVSQLMVYGASPSGITSGAALDSLRAIDESRLSLVGDNIRDGVLEVARQWLHIFKRYASGYRAISVCGKNDSGRVAVWCKDDISSFDVYFENENELRESEAEQRSRFLEAFNAGLFTGADGTIDKRLKARAIEAMKLGTYDDITSNEDLQVQNARNENSDFSCGIIPELGDFDDHELHIDEHTRFALGSDYKILKRKMPQYAQAFKEHIEAHQAAIQNSKAATIPLANMIKQKRK